CCCPRVLPAATHSDVLFSLRQVDSFVFPSCYPRAARSLLLCPTSAHAVGALLSASPTSHALSLQPAPQPCPPLPRRCDAPRLHPSSHPPLSAWRAARAAAAWTTAPDCL